MAFLYRNSTDVFDTTALSISYYEISEHLALHVDDEVLWVFMCACTDFFMRLMARRRYLLRSAYDMYLRVLRLLHRQCSTHFFLITLPDERRLLERHMYIVEAAEMHALNRHLIFGDHAASFYEEVAPWRKPSR